MNKPVFRDAIALVEPDFDKDNWSDVDDLPTSGMQQHAAATAKLVELLAEYDAQLYARNRKPEYDALNQFELISDDDANGTTTHKDAIAAIKTKWPKDNSGPVE